MNKLWLLLSVLVIALFVVSCAPKEEVGEEDVEVIEEVEEGGALAGQAVSDPCNDPDAVPTDKFVQVLTNSTTSKGSAKWKDQCQTLKGKIILKEGICIAGKMATLQYDCSKQNKLPGDKFECVSGACVNKGVPTCTPQCAGKTCGDNGCGGICGECADDEECKDGACVMLNAPAAIACTDSDNTPVSGDQLPSLLSKGKVVSKEYPQGIEDSCKSNSLLNEVLCSGGSYSEFTVSCNVLNEKYNGTSACKNGACVNDGSYIGPYYVPSDTVNVTGNKTNSTSSSNSSSSSSGGGNST